MWIRVALVLLLGLPWLAPVGAASVPSDPSVGNSVDLGSVVITAGDSETTSVEAGQPAIDLTPGSASGLAPGMVLVIGDVDAPLADHAFALANRGEASAAVELRYEYNRPPSSEAGVSFAAYDATGTRLADGDETLSVELLPDESAYVVVTISTHGLSPRDDLSGSLEFTMTSRA